MGAALTRCFSGSASPASERHESVGAFKERTRRQAAKRWQAMLSNLCLVDAADKRPTVDMWVHMTGIVGMPGSLNRRLKLPDQQLLSKHRRELLRR